MVEVLVRVGGEGRPNRRDGTTDRTEGAEAGPAAGASARGGRVQVNEHARTERHVRVKHHVRVNGHVRVVPGGRIVRVVRTDG
ncbi:hypothetical protein ACFV94_14485 [Streptomyces sp. NPDC059896]|uniref:hypothetical protein n=1 Tax=unclassified Streptomyces TaxID=2593676 RepID=UPI0036549257